ncbi:neurogenic locus notch homolog protein 1-like [Mercenaria mercenaria]|uniref:neurogenic locus notch homolog protein 1-like n=1 Tax=Mercenaria mercenaria TaxID=6596 RepID=UPI00234E955F|nr:neurogenic locus notch homolog protein 1-like [Mercenaria mercenaria]
MDNIQFLLAKALLVMYVIIVSNDCADSTDSDDVISLLSSNLKQPRLPAQGFPFQSKLLKNLGKQYPAHGASGDLNGFECPDGYRKRIRGGVEFCSPTKTEQEIVEDKGPLCPEGQFLVDSLCMDTAQHNIVPHLCPYGKVKFISGNQAHCVDGISLKDISCDKGTSLIHTKAGWMCEITHAPVQIQKHSYLSNKLPYEHQFKELKSGPNWDKDTIDVPKCENGKVAAMTQDGYVCIDPVFPSSVCPAHLVPAMSSRGIQCIPCPYGQNVVRIEDVVKCERTDMVTTEVPCPQGLQPIQTPVGRVCQYMPSAVSGHVQKCPEGKVRHAGGKIVCSEKEECPPGQNKLRSDDGRENCMTPQLTDVPYCLEGEVFYEGACISLHLAEKFRSDSKNPCIPGHFLFVSNFGSVCQPITEGQEIHSHNILQCGPGSVVTQTAIGFQCLLGELPSYVIPMCEHGFGIAKLGESYECISIYDADLICSADEQMVRVDGGFVCEKFIPERHCGPDEFYRTNEGGGIMCISHHQATELCGDGYVAVREAESFLCKKLLEDVNCPVGYSLTVDHGEPLCIEEGAKCVGIVDLPSSGCLNQAPHCQQGYYLNMDLDAPHCALVLNQQFQQSQTDLIVQPCDAEGGIRPCDLPADMLLSGCNPDCANGGTCDNDTCLCPPGITGHACHIDVNECESWPCEYGCENTFGTYQCTCPVGMLLGTDGQTCSDPGCIPDCLNNGQCVRGHCRCASEFEGLYCQIDKDECAKYGDRLCQHQCRNTYGGYTCICPPGSRLNPDGRTCLNTTCIPACRNGGSCKHHRCHCPSGFYGIICQFDVNECRTEKPCDQTCINTWGSYVCSCNEGYTLHTDEHTCIPVTDIV